MLKAVVAGVPWQLSVQMRSLCETCNVTESKYTCPACQMRTCSLPCVREHKKSTGCAGSRLALATPGPMQPSNTYTEQLFLRDYSFLEGMSSYVETLESPSNTATEGQAAKGHERQSRGGRAALFRRIQRLGRLAELHVLPESFSRAKRNQTRIIRVDGGAREEGETVEERSSRKSRVAWSLDIVRADSLDALTDKNADCRTMHNVRDDTRLESLLEGRVTRVFLKNESRQSVAGRFVEIARTRWTEPLSLVLHNARCVEYPVFVLVDDTQTSQ